ncbi:teichuronic acid biosynthesis protein TuaE [Peribacillus glennii]|uniref:O-antigen ligase domain-containing protein n=1 Tax=Peribacillus glennii TaxID=2303991 RepID=A0A372LEA3_9BACI|nr:O-antigen ligase family protein [Peribacillus glennii]RFU63986.1 O-antigen ligase domain-containing protein [Peribacillus glennii]
MESIRNGKIVTSASAFLMIGLLIICSLSGMEVQFLIFLGIWCAVFLAVFTRPYVSSKQLFTLFMYCLVITTFLNQSVVDINIGFFHLFLYRIVLIAAAGFFLVHAFTDQELPQYWNRVQVKGSLLFLLFWLAYGTASLIWAKSVGDGVKYLFLLGIGVLFVFLAVFTFTGTMRLLLFYGIWMGMTVLLLFIGLLNHVFELQLPSSSLYGASEYKLGYPTAVFYNQNDFATFLTISFIFYLALVRNGRSAWVKVSGLLLAFLSVYIIYLTESRASLLAIMVGSGAYLFILLPKRVMKAAAMTGIAAVVLGTAVLFGKITEWFYRLFSLSAYYPGYEVLPSSLARSNLLKNTFHYVLDTFGFGVGAGNLPYYLENEPVYHTNYVIEVHNWLAEILGNFGIVVFLGYVTMYGYLWWSLYQLHRANQLQSRSQKMLLEACLIALIAFLVSSISPSTVINLYFHWVFLGFVMAVVSVFKEKSSPESECKRGQLSLYK